MLAGIVILILGKGDAGPRGRTSDSRLRVPCPGCPIALWSCLPRRDVPSVQSGQKSAPEQGAREACDAQVPVRDVLHLDGARGVIKDGGSKRRAAIEAVLKSLGGRLEAFYFAYGETDAFVIVELPDTVSATAVAHRGRRAAPCGSRRRS